MHKLKELDVVYCSDEAAVSLLLWVKQENYPLLG